MPLPPRIPPAHPVVNKLPLGGTVIVEAAAAAPITSAMAYVSSGTRAMQYSLHLTAELL